MKSLSLRNGLSRMLFWSVISAAFIGPGTVTTCSLAGASFGTALLWALTFSTLATLILQEAAARITLASSRSLGEILIQRHGLRGRWINRSLAGAVILGCAAYEAGNLLGAVAGIKLILDIPVWILSMVLGLLAFSLLKFSQLSVLTRLLGILVFLLGFAFVVVSLGAMSDPVKVLTDSILPQIPVGSALIITGLVGTTIVPYNLFLASGIGQGQTVAQMRQGLIPAILLGGLISMAILVAGTLIVGEFSFQNAAQVLGQRLGSWGEVLYALGLFGAGFTSLITAPLAASLTAKTLLATTERQTSYVWQGVLVMGIVFGVAQFRPIPVILAAQVANGLLLPFITWQLFRCLNDRNLMPEAFLNTKIQNVFFVLIFLVTLFLSGNSLYAALR